MSDPILYLMSKYTGREADSVKENQDAWLALNAKGYLVYSPICETHNVEERRLSLRVYDKNEFEKPIFEDKYKAPDYVARDLALIEKFMNKDAIYCNGCPSECQFHDMDRVNERAAYNMYCQRMLAVHLNKYDSGVVGVVLPSAYHTDCNCTWERMASNCLNCPDIFKVWDSKGAKQEYEFMHSKHILVISLETALTIPPEQWGVYSL